MSALWNSSARFAIALLLFLNVVVDADILSSCRQPSSEMAETCSAPLQDITVVVPKEYVVAKLQCYGCPTTLRVGHGEHIVTNKENALFFNISLSTSRTQLLLNSVPVFPSLQSPPPNIYAAQLPLEFSLFDLSYTIECSKLPCANYDGICDCFQEALGGMGLSYDYAVLPKEDGPLNEWTVQLDAIGGQNGYQVDPHVEFQAPEQQKLQIDIKQHGHQGMLEIVGAELVPRELQHQPTYQDQESAGWFVSTWKKVLIFLGLRSEEGEPGHVVYWFSESDSYGKVGTLKHFLRELWGGWRWDLVGIYAASCLGGLALSYSICRRIGAVRKAHDIEDYDGRNDVDEEYKWSEREGLLGQEDDENTS